MKQKSLNTVLLHKANQLKEKEYEAKCLQEKAFSIPEISNAQKDFINTSFELLDPTSKVTQKDVDNKHALYISALKKHGFSEEIFKVNHICNKCDDTGFNNGRICSCVWDEYIKQLEIDCNILNTCPFTFNDFNESLIKDENQKAFLKKLYSTLKGYVNKYPNINIHTITLFGKTGTGKTALAQAMAREMVNNGQSALFMTAYEFNELMLKVHTSPIEIRNNLLSDVLSCDMLVIDDLGTEPVYKKVTVEYLLLVLEQRLNKKLSTIITTNLSLDNIMSRYYERIYSRICDKAHSKVLELKGLDLRM